MKRSLFTIGCAVLMLTMTIPAAAAQRTTQPQANAAHEKLKKQADDAYRKSRYSECIKLTSLVLQQNPSDHVAYYLRASARVEVALRSGDAREMRGGINDAREAIKYDRNRNAMYYLPYLYGMSKLTEIENKKEHAEVAVKFADQLIKLGNLKADMKANVWYQRGNANVALRKFEEAASDFLAALQASPTHMGAYLSAANAYAMAGKLEKAEQQYDAAVKAFPKNALVFNNRGMFLRSRGKVKEAIADFTQALANDANYISAYTNRGYVLFQQGQPKAAEADFSRSLLVNSRQPAVYSLRAAARIAQGNVVRAIEDNRAVLRLTPRSPSAHADLGFTLFFAGNFKESESSFGDALKLDPNQKHLWTWQFLAMELNGKKDKALAGFKPVLDKPAKDRSWGDWVLAFAAGKVDGNALLKAVAQKNEAAKQAQLCEAHYFIGLQAARAKNAVVAKTHFALAVATKQRQLSAYQGATLALRKLAETQK